jgi:hypothetical protein
MDESDVNAYLRGLTQGELFTFADWPNPAFLALRSASTRFGLVPAITCTWAWRDALLPLRR